MGAIRDAAKSFDGEPVAKKDLENQLDNMSALANTKADLFELNLRSALINAGTGDNKNIPVKFIIDFTRQTHSYASSSADSIASTVTEAIKNFIHGGQDNIMNGVSSLLTKAIQALFDSREGLEDEKHFVSVFAEGRSLVRLDVKAWKRFTKVDSLTNSAEQISAFVMCKSTINVVPLDYNTFTNLYQNVLYEKSTGFSPDEIAIQLQKIEAIYRQFLDAENTKATGAAKLVGNVVKFPAPTEQQLTDAEDAVANAEARLLK